MHRDATLRRIITWSAILGYALVVSGLPLPLGAVAPAAATDPAASRRLASKDRSRPFPCMDKSCGCATAEQCFTHCCCNTPAETLVWAKAHRVEPAVIAALQRRVTAAPAVPAASCCSARKPSNGGAAAAEPAGCTADSPAAPADDASRDEPVAPRTVVLRAMLACGGIAAQWFSIGVSLPPPAAIAVAHASGRIERNDLTDDHGSPQRAAPATPPPRAA